MTNEMTLEEAKALLSQWERVVEENHDDFSAGSILSWTTKWRDSSGTLRAEAYEGFLGIHIHILSEDVDMNGERALLAYFGGRKASKLLTCGVEKRVK